MADGEATRWNAYRQGGSRHATPFIIAPPSRMMATAGNPVATVDRERLVAYRVPDGPGEVAGTADRGENCDGHVIAPLAIPF
jgi:hypothetical protein